MELKKIKVKICILKEDPSLRLFLAMLFAIFQFAWAYNYYSYKLNTTGILVPEEAASNLLGNLVQAAIVSVPMIILILFSRLLARKDFKEKFFLSIPEGYVKIIIAAAGALYLAELFLGLLLKSDKVSILYQWFYYLIAIGFLEEFTWRGIIPKLLKDKLPDEWVWLTPNMLFALMHGVLPLVSGRLKLIPFLRTDFIYFTALGLLMEWIKRKTGSLWLPVLIHAIFDFLFVF